jgi:hypothetical protein
LSPRLYSLDLDINERTNVASAHPEIVERLRLLAIGMNSEIGGESHSARRPAGKVAKTRLLYATGEWRPRARNRGTKPPSSF